MRSTLAFSTALTLFAVTLPSGAISDEAKASLPSRKAGLWELNTAMDEGNGPRTQSMKMCIDATMEKNTVAASMGEHKEACKTYEIATTGDGTTVAADCIFNKRRVVSTTTMSGDFKTAFEIKITSKTTDPAEKTQLIVVNRTITQRGKFLAESCGALKGGEAEAEDGTKVMVQ